MYFVLQEIANERGSDDRTNQQGQYVDFIIVSE